VVVVPEPPELEPHDDKTSGLATSAAIKTTRRALDNLDGDRSEILCMGHSPVSAHFSQMHSTRFYGPVQVTKVLNQSDRCDAGQPSVTRDHVGTDQSFAANSSRFERRSSFSHGDQCGKPRSKALRVPPDGLRPDHLGHLVSLKFRIIFGPYGGVQLRKVSIACPVSKELILKKANH
jgi:hypothetical protein